MVLQTSYRKQLCIATHSTRVTEVEMHTPPSRQGLLAGKFQLSGAGNPFRVDVKVLRIDPWLLITTEIS